MGKQCGETGHRGRDLSVFRHNCGIVEECLRCDVKSCASDFSLLLGSHVGHQVAHAVAVSKLVVVPGGRKKRERENRRRDYEPTDGRAREAVKSARQTDAP